MQIQISSRRYQSIRSDISQCVYIISCSVHAIDHQSNTSGSHMSSYMREIQIWSQLYQYIIRRFHTYIWIYDLITHTFHEYQSNASGSMGSSYIIVYIQHHLGWYLSCMHIQISSRRYQSICTDIAQCGHIISCTVHAIDH